MFVSCDNRGAKIDIREHYEKEGEVRPTQKGCSLSLSAFEKLVGSLSQVHTEVANRVVVVGLDSKCCWIQYEGCALGFAHG